MKKKNPFLQQIDKKKYRKENLLDVNSGQKTEGKQRKFGWSIHLLEFEIFLDSGTESRIESQENTNKT